MELRRQRFQLAVVLHVLADSVVVAARHHQVNARSSARRKRAPQRRQGSQGQAQVLLSLVSVEREEQVGGSLRDQPPQALRFSGRLVKCARVQGGIEDICLDPCETLKGLPEDSRGELAVYQNLYASKVASGGPNIVAFTRLQ